MDYNQTGTYYYEEPDEIDHYEPPLMAEVSILNYCGTVLNTVFTILVALAMMMSSQNRRLPRMWLLLGLVVAHLATSAYSIYTLREASYWATYKWTYISCTLSRSVAFCLDFVTILISALLACHVFMWTFIPSVEKGRKTLVFWIVAEVVAWLLGFIIILAIKAPFTEILTISGGRSKHTFCTTNRVEGGAIEIVELCLRFLLPFLFALPISCASTCFTIWMKYNTKDDTIVELEILSGHSQSHAIDPEKQEEVTHSTEASHRTSTHWVIFTMVLIFFGFSLRLPERLSELGVFRDAVFDNNPNDVTIVMTFMLLRVVYYSFILAVSLVLPEVRGIMFDFYRHCKRICGRA